MPSVQNCFADEKPRPTQEPIVSARCPALFTALTLTATAALTLSACGSDDSPGKGKDAVAEADMGTTSPSASPTESESSKAGRPKIELPADLSYSFEWPKSGDQVKDAILADAEQSIKAVDLAIVNQDALDKAYLYYYEGEAAPARRSSSRTMWIKRRVSRDATASTPLKWRSMKTARRPSRTAKTKAGRT